MSQKTLKFDDAEVNRKEFYTSKQPNSIDSVDIHIIVVSDKFIRPLCAVLPQ